MNRVQSYCHVAGAFEPASLRQARAYLERVRAGAEAVVSSEREANAVRRGEMCDSVRLDPAWFGVWLNPSVTLLDAIGRHTWVIYPPQVRAMQQIEQQVPWHQDIGFMRLLNKRGHERFITCFLPLEEEPHLHATVELAQPLEHELAHVPKNGFGAGIDDKEIRNCVHFNLALGDAILFTEFVPHRTCVPPGARVDRRSLEFRLVCPDDSIPDKDYFDITSQRFVRQHHQLSDIRFNP